ncbi:sodium- and chloride-dependent taurine transporter-like [Pollicipes pollicipes]|uniref:sodium- and chloride-dependent taurine transporter-like n=1 Tax=Pollicipes pollicipes TaxID=41117 RepID=UPI001884FD05|nr:sodium- and chloride-dependent taurine transporter-like [Pollicipes pollicipes]
MTRVLLFPGAWSGIAMFFYGRVDFAKLLHRDLWVDSIGMTYWSVNIGMGMIPTLGSRDRLRQRAFFTSACIVFIDLGFGMLNSLLMFMVRGNLEQQSEMMRQQLEELDDDSQGLAFVSFTAIVDSMPRPQFWGVLYFGAMVAQSLGRVTMTVICCGLNLIDAVPLFRRVPFAATVIVAFAPGLAFAGTRIYSMLNGVKWSIDPLMRIQWTLATLLFTVIIGLKLSASAFLDEVRTKLGQDIASWRQFLLVSWLFISPVMMVFELMRLLETYRSPPVSAGAQWTAAFGYIAAAAPLLVALVVTVRVCLSTPFMALCRTSAEFRPDPRALHELHHRRSSRRHSSMHPRASWRASSLAGGRVAPGDSQAHVPRDSKLLMTDSLESAGKPTRSPPSQRASYDKQSDSFYDEDLF